MFKNESVKERPKQFYAKLLAHHQLVNLLLLNGVHALRHNLWGYQVVNVVHRLWRQTLLI